MIGINDIHRWFYKVPNQSVSPEEFADYYPRILERVKKETKAQITLIDPFYMSADTTEGSDRAGINRYLPDYIKTVHRMVKQFKARHVKLHAIFQEQIKLRSPNIFCPEPVHPNSSGHLLMAQKWLETVGY